MSKLDELIKEICPNGVEFRDLENCCHILDSRRKPVTRAAREAGKYPYYGANGIQDYVSDYIFDGTFILVGEDGSVQTEYGTPVVNWATGKIWVNNHAHIVEAVEGVDLRYLYHNLQTIDIHSLIHGNIPKLNQGDFRSLKIAVPPLAVQREIVRILDSFTLLTAELTAELTARKKQYDFYRDKLLDIKGNRYVLEDVCQIVDCPHTSPKWKKEGIPVIRNYNLVDGNIDTTMLSYVDEEEYKNRVKRIIPREGDILFSREAPIGNVGIIPKGFICCQGQRVVLLRPNQQIVCPQFLSYVLQGSVVRKQIEKIEAVGSTVSNFNISDLRKLQFELPSVEEQELIAEKMNAFSKICADMKQGLPAEIAARQRQYGEEN